MNKHQLNNVKSCACGNIKACRTLQNTLYGLKYYYLCGWVTIQTKYSTHGDNNLKPAQRNRRMVAHMWPNGIPLQDVSFIDKEKRVTLAKHHFNYSILMKYKSEGDSIPHTVTRDEGRELGYTDDADMVRGEPNTFWFCPTLFNFDNYLKDLASMTASSCTLIQLKALTSESSSQSIIDLSSRQITLRKQTEKCNSRDIKAAIKQAQEQQRIEKDENDRRDQEKENFLKTMSKSDKIESIQEFAYQQHLFIIKLQDVIEGMKNEKENQLEARLEDKILHSGLARCNILNESWHEENIQMAKHLFGFSSFQEYVEYIKCFWPNIFSQSRERASTSGSNSTELTLLEKRSIVKMAFTRNFSNIVLGAIWGVTNTRIAKILEEEVPAWNTVALHLSILSTSKDYLEKCETEAFIKAGYSKHFGCDGKDIKIGSFPSNPFVQAAIWSDKDHHEGFRGIAWNLGFGLSVEHTALFGARTAEQALVKIWGSYFKSVPLIKTIETRKRQGVGIFGSTTSKSSIPKAKAKKSRTAGGSNIEDSDSGEDESDAKINGDMFEQYLRKQDEGVKKRMANAVKLAAASLAETDADDQYAEGHVTTSMIEQDHMKLLEAYGPDKDCDSKLEQIDLLKRLDDSYKQGRLKKCMLSHYVHHFMPNLLDMRRIIVHSDPDKPELYCVEIRAEGEHLQATNKYPTRLGKFPSDWCCMCDKGFAKCQVAFPNMNQCCCPHFLDGGKQFTPAELLYDMSLKKLRWKDEGVFSCLTDEELVATVIPSHRVKYAEAAWNWGIARNNLSQPKYKPKDWEEFISNDTAAVFDDNSNDDVF